MLPNQNSKDKLFARTVFKICGTQQVFRLALKIPPCLTFIVGSNFLFWVGAGGNYHSGYTG